jgi:hypothetical protein
MSYNPDTRSDTGRHETLRHDNQRSDIDIEVLLRRLVDVISNAKSMPLSTSVLISKDEVLELLSEAVLRLPEDLKNAKWVLRERTELLEKATREGEEIVEAARGRAERMVQRTQVVRDAKRAATRIIEDAEEESRRLRHEADQFCDRKLANFEIVLDRLSKMVQAGREKLQGGPPDDSGRARSQGGPGIVGGQLPIDTAAEDAFFDQDR